jgi:hypothetical protein
LSHIRLRMIDVVKFQGYLSYTSTPFHSLYDIVVNLVTSLFVRSSCVQFSGAIYVGIRTQIVLVLNIILLLCIERSEVRIPASIPAELIFTFLSIFKQL